MTSGCAIATVAALLLIHCASSATATIDAGHNCTGKSADLPVAECAAWQKFFDSTRGPHWSRVCSDRRLDPCGCDDGVLCGDSHIIGIDLDSNGLNGTIDKAIGSLSKLSNLMLQNNTLRGTMPKELGSLSALETLQLWNNVLSGTIPKELGPLSELTSLGLYGNQLRGIAPALPFAQYDNGACCLVNNPAAHGAPATNKIACPLPAGARKCNCYYGGNAYLGLACK